MGGRIEQTLDSAEAANDESTQARHDCQRPRRLLLDVHFPVPLKVRQRVRLALPALVRDPATRF